MNSSEPRHDPARGQNQIFCFAQDPAFRVARFRQAVFVDQTSVALRINARAAGEEKDRLRKKTDEIFCALKIEPAILFFVAAA